MIVFYIAVCLCFMVKNDIVYIQNLSRKFMLPCGQFKMAACVNKIEIMQINHV